MSVNIIDLIDAFEGFFIGMKILPQSSEGKYPAYLQAIPSEEKEGIHFELIQRRQGDCVFLEFHVERSHYWEYADEVDRLTRAFAQHSRDIEHASYYSSQIWRCRRPIEAPENLSNLAQEVVLLKTVVEECLSVKTSMSDVDVLCAGQSDVEIVQIQIIKLLDTWNLAVPHVQREYCWDDKNINRLMSDLQNWKDQHSGLKYHLGSVILKETDDNTCEIFDGQQRLTTFALWLRAANGKDVSLLNNKGMYSRYSRRKIREAWKIFNDRDKGQDNELLAWVNDWVEVSVVKIAASAPRDLPFRFFNHVNSSGVRLTDYDLLKSHHLRFVDSGIAQEAARRWHDLELMPDGNSPLTERMLHQTLFRLRMWSIGDVEHFPFDAANTDERLLFRHFHATAETPSGVMAFPRPMQFDSLVTGGAAFFDFVSRQRTAFEAFTLEAPVKLLDKFLSWHSRGVLWSGIRALCFLYYLRFGASYLGKAVELVSEYISQIRNETRVLGAYLSKQPHFRRVCDLLRRATDEGQFFAAMNAIAVKYQRDDSGVTKKNYWKALSELEKELKNV